MRRTARRSTGPDVARPTPEPGPGRTHQSLYSMRSLRRKSRLAGASHGAVRPQLCDPDRDPCWPGRRGHPRPGRPAARHRQRPDAGDCERDSTGCASIPPSAIQNNCPNCRGVGDRLRGRPRVARRMAGGSEDGLCLRPRCEFHGLVWVHRHAHRDSSERQVGRGFPEVVQRRPRHGASRRRGLGPLDRRDVPCGHLDPVLRIRLRGPPDGAGPSPAHPVHRGVRFRSESRRPLCPTGRRDLHEGGRRRGGPGWEGRKRDPRGRPAKPRGNRGPRGRQRRRLRGPRRGPVRIDRGGEHRGDGHRCGVVRILRSRGNHLPTRRSRIRSHRLDCGRVRRAGPRGGVPHGGAQPRIPRDDDHRGNPVRDRGVGHAPASGRERRGRVDLASVLALRPRGHDHGVPVRVAYPVLDGGAISTRAGDREILGDGPGDEHPLGLLRRPRGDMASGARRLRRVPDLVLCRAVDRDHDFESGQRRALRNRDCDDGHALNRRLHPGDGHVRPDRGQRRRDRPDVRDVGGRASEHGQARRRREHDEGSHERVCGGERRPGRVPPVQRVAEGSERRRVRHGSSRDVPRWFHRGCPRLPVHGVRNPRGRSSRLGDHQRCARPVSREPGHHGGHLEARLRAIRQHRDAGCLERDDRPRSPRSTNADRGWLLLPIRPRHARPRSGGTARRDPHGRDDRGSPDGAHTQHGRGSLGQREEVHRGGQPRRKGQSDSQSGGGRRHCGRSVQRHRGAVAAHPCETAFDDHAGHCPSPDLASAIPKERPFLIPCGAASVPSVICNRTFPRARRRILQPAQEQPGSAPSPPPIQTGGRNPRTVRLIAIIIVIVLALSAVTAYYVLFLQSSACNFSSTNPLIFDQPERPDTLDPHVTFSTPGWGIVQQVYQSLVNYNGTVYTTFVPVLAKSWSTDGLNYTFVLRQDVHFSNGDPFNAYVMWFSLYRAIIMNADGAFILQENFWLPGVNYYSDTNDTDNATAWMTVALNTWNFFSPTTAQKAIMAADNNSFQAIDAYTLVLHAGYGYLGPYPYAFLLASVAGPIASAVDPAVVQQNGGVLPGDRNAWMATHMVGTGPYVLAGGVLDIESAPSYTLNPDSSYWGVNASKAEPLNNIIQPAKATIQVDFQGDPAIGVNDMKTGKVLGASFAYIGPSTVHSLQGVPCVAVNALDTVYGSTAGGWWIYMNQSTEPFTNWSVREAVVHAINYQRIIDVAFGTYAERWVGPVPPG